MAGDVSSELTVEISEIKPQIVNLDHLEDYPRNEVIYYSENHNNYTSETHPWTHNFSEPGDDWCMPNPAWNLSNHNRTYDIDKGNIWGPALNCDNEEGDDSRHEFGLYYDGGYGALITQNYSLQDVPPNLFMTINHRYDFDYHSGSVESHNGGNVRISIDGSDDWELITPVEGYPGSIHSNEGYGNPLYGQPGFVHCSDSSCGAGDNDDTWINSSFFIGRYTGHDVRFMFIFGLYNYSWPGDGEHWYIDEFKISSWDDYFVFRGNVDDDSNNITNIYWNSSLMSTFSIEEAYAEAIEGTGFSVGNHTITLEAKNDINETAIDNSWLNIVRDPVVDLIQTPGQYVNDSNVSFHFEIITTLNSTSFCRRDQSDWQSCSSPLNYMGLADGLHTFSIYAIDEYGYESAITNATWTVDTVPPVVEIMSGPDYLIQSNSLTDESQIIATWSNDTDKVQCKLVIRNIVGNWSSEDCYYSLEPFSGELGSMEFHIKAIDYANNSGVSVWKWNQFLLHIDSIAPLIRIDGNDTYGNYYGELLTFSVNSTEVSNCTSELQWFSDADGVIGLSHMITVNSLTKGMHYIKITKTYDCDGGIWVFEDIVENYYPIEIWNNHPYIEVLEVDPNPQKAFTEVSLHCGAYDVDGVIIEYKWAVVSPSNEPIFIIGNTQNDTITNLSAGQHWVACNVKDNDGDWSSWSMAELDIYPNELPSGLIESIIGSEDTIFESIYAVNSYEHDYWSMRGSSGCWNYLPFWTTPQNTLFSDDIYKGVCISTDSVVSFNSFVHDYDGTVVAYEWVSDIDGVLSDERNFTTTGLSVGIHTITLEVQDNDGDWSTISSYMQGVETFVGYNSYNLEVIPNFYPVVVNNSLSDALKSYGNVKLLKSDNLITVNADVVDSDGNIVLYCWTLDDGAPLCSGVGSDYVITLSELDFGGHTLVLSITDNDGDSSAECVWTCKDVIHFTIYALPIADAGDDITIKPNSTVEFNAQGSDADGEIVRFEWDLDGDGVYEMTSSSFSYNYIDEGSYTVFLRVTDNQGYNDTDSLTITVTNNPEKSKDNKDEPSDDNTTKEEDDSNISVPSISLISSISAVAVIALRRRY